MMVDRARPQRRLWEIRPVGCIRPYLRLQAEAGKSLVIPPFQPLARRHILASVKLDAGFRGPDLHLNAGTGSLRPCSLPQRSARRGKAEILVVGQLFALGF